MKAATAELQSGISPARHRRMNELC
jgi:hypothetical protein